MTPSWLGEWADGKLGSVQIWDWKTGKRLARTKATPGDPRVLAFRPDGPMLAAACADNCVMMIDLRLWAITRHLEPTENYGTSER